MKIILFTQEDPFYLVESTHDLIQKINTDGKHSIIQAIITPPSPFGRKETFKQKAVKTYRIFGIDFNGNLNFKIPESKYLYQDLEHWKTQQSKYSVLKDD